MAESLIWSENELKKFYNFFYAEREITDTDFFCLASRRKYLTEEEKANIKMGDTVMLCKTVLKDYNWPKFLSKIRQADAMSEFVLDSNDNYIPKKCCVMYMNINHTSVIKAIKEFKETMAGWDSDTLTLLEFGNIEKRLNLCRQYKSASEGLLKAFQNPKNGNDKWIDIDCDIEGDESCREKLGKEILNYFNNLFDDTHRETLALHRPKVIITHGGIHFLISKDIISKYNSFISLSHNKKEMKNFVLTPESIIKKVKEILANVESKEIIINPNKMVPIPGTVQGGFKVRMLS